MSADSSSSSSSGGSSVAAALDRGSRLMLAGGGAGAITKSVIAPFERVKILCQTGESSGLLATYARILKEEGVLGFWRSNWANIVRIIPSKGVLFMCSDAFRDLLRSPNDVSLPVWKSFLAGSLSGGATVFFTYPLDFVRGRIAGNLGRDNKYTGMIRTVQLTVKEEGPAALYCGVWPTFVGSFPYEGIKFGAYDWLKKHAPRDETGQIPQFWKLTCGAAAGTLASVAVFPNDTVRRRLQMQGQGGRANLYSGALDCYQQLWAKHGLPVFYRGLSANLLRVVPNAALQFWSYEALKTLLGVTTRA